MAWWPMASTARGELLRVKEEGLALPASSSAYLRCPGIVDNSCPYWLSESLGADLLGHHYIGRFATMTT